MGFETAKMCINRIRLSVYVAMVGVILAMDFAAAEPVIDFSAGKFANPQDKGFLPGVGESEEKLNGGITKSFDRNREVSRWEKTGKRGRIISREIWNDNEGQARGRFSIGRPF